MPGGGPSSQAVWTGTTILTTTGVLDSEGTFTDAVALARYDLSTDTWDIVDDDASYTALVGLPDSDGMARTVIALPFDTGAPVAVLDSDGNSIGSLPGIPATAKHSATDLSAVGVWAGEEALFWIHSGDGVFIPADGPFEGWALNPATKTWRPLPDNNLISQIGYNAGELVAAGDVVLAWEGGRTSPTARRPPPRPGNHPIPVTPELPQSAGPGLSAAPIAQSGTSRKRLATAYDECRRQISHAVCRSSFGPQVRGAQLGVHGTPRVGTPDVPA